MEGIRMLGVLLFVYYLSQRAVPATAVSSTSSIQDVFAKDDVIITTSTEQSHKTTTQVIPEVTNGEAKQQAEDVILEFEESLTEKQTHKYMVYRSEASGNRSVHITDRNSHKKFSTTLCVNSTGDYKVQVQVIGITYSNDGPSDTIVLTLDGNSLGFAKTDQVYNGGNEWNVFKSTGPIGKPTVLSNGNYTLTMVVKTDKWGAELDTMTMQVQHQDPDMKLFCRMEFV